MEVAMNAPTVMRDRKTARLVGALFIVATIAGVLSLLCQLPIVDAPDFATAASLHESRLVTGAFFEIIMSIAIVAIAVAIYPVLLRYSERLALGYVVARTVEAVLFAIDTVALLMLLTLSREIVSGSASDPSHLFGGMLAAERDWVGAVIGSIAFAISALVLNLSVYKARLVPRWLSGWGLVGATLYLAAAVMVLFAPGAVPETQLALQMPMAFQEMVLAVWLISKGFDEAELAAAQGRSAGAAVLTRA